MQPEEDGTQLAFDFTRGEQLRLLRDCELPKRAKDHEGKGVTAIVLKSVLKAIDDFGRGRRCTAAVDSLAKSACISRRQCFRALEVLGSLGLVCAENDWSRWGKRGSPTTARTIVWSELALLCDRSHLQRTGQPTDQSAPEGTLNQGATPTDQSALGADQSALGADQSALGADQSAPEGTQYDHDTTRSACEAPSDVVVAGAKKTFFIGRVARSRGEPPAADGERRFFEDELAAVRAKANRINAQACTHTVADRELVLKVATLWHDGLLSDDMVEQVLESYDRKRDAGAPVKNRCAWLFQALRNQCQRYGVSFEQLLARTEFPRELLPPRPRFQEENL